MSPKASCITSCAEMQGEETRLKIVPASVHAPNQVSQTRVQHTCARACGRKCPRELSAAELSFAATATEPCARFACRMLACAGVCLPECVCGLACTRMGAFSASLSAREPARASTTSRCLNSMVRTQDSCHSSSSPADSNGNMYRNGAVALHLHPTFLAEQPASWTVITCKPLDNPATCTWPSALSNTPSVLSSSSTSTPCPAGNGSPLDAKTENSISGAC